MAKNWINSLKYYMGFVTYEDEENGEENVVEESSKSTDSSTFQSIPSPRSSSSYSSSSSYKNSATSSMSSVQMSSMKVVLYQPTEFEDAKTVVDSLNEKKPVVLNLEMMEGNEAKKIFDFCNGAIYAMGGKIEKISRGIFLLAPKNVDVLGDMKEELSNKGIFAWNSVE